MMRQKKGFTLVELMIVIAIIVVVASVAIPASLRARVQSNEAAAVGNLRTLSSAAEGFRSSQNPPAYAASLAAMITSNPAYLDASWNNPQKQGYLYTYTVAAGGDTFSTTGNPRTVNVSGVNGYCVDHSGVIRRYNNGNANGDANGCNNNGVPI